MILSLIQDPYRKGGTATVINWYRSWLSEHRPFENVEVFLDDSSKGLLEPESERRPGSIPRLLPKLQVPQYLMAKRALAPLESQQFTEVHIVGASVLHGIAAPKGIPTLIWMGTTIGDERRPTMLHQDRLRRLAYRATLPALERFESRVLMGSSKVMTHSPHTANCVERIGVPKEKVQVKPVPITIPPEITKPSQRQGCLFVGRVNDPRKGFPRLSRLLAASTVVREHGMRVVSPSEPDGWLRKRVDERSLEWLGQVAELNDVYQSSELFLLPSHQEGLGIVVFEALANGTPVVAFKCGGPDEYLRESGGGVVVDDEKAFRRAVERLLSNSEEREEMGERGRRWVIRRMNSIDFLKDPDVFRM